MTVNRIKGKRAHVDKGRKKSKVSLDHLSTKEHKVELQKLKSSDPDFFNYLQENDAELLNFGEEEDDDSVDADDTIEANEDNFSDDIDEESNIQQAKTGGTVDISKTRSFTTEVTVEMLQAVAAGAVKGSVGDLKRLLSMFRAASQPLFQDIRHEEDDPPVKIPMYSISSPDVFQAVMTTSIESIAKSLIHLLELKIPTKKKLEELGNHKRWKKLQVIVLTFFKLIVQNLNAVGLSAKHHEVTVFLIDSLERYIPFLSPLPRLTKTVLRVLLVLWIGPSHDGNEQSEHQRVRGHSLLRVRQMAAQLPGAMMEECFRATYLKFARACKHFSEGNINTVLYLTNCVAELYKLDAAISYQQAFLYIRQLALHLRAEIMKKSDTGLKTIRNWQFLNCLRLWTRVISSQPKVLNMLCFPLAQIIIGLLSIPQSPYYAPMRLHLVEYLQTLSAHCEVFIPCAHYVCELLECEELFNKSNASTDIVPGLAYILTLPSNSLSKQQTKDVLVSEILNNLRLEVEIYRFNPGFPEYAFLISRRLKFFMKQTKQSKWRDSTRSLLSQIQSFSAAAISKRASPHFSPQMTHLFEGLLSSGEPVASDRLAKFLISRAKLLSSLSSSSPADTTVSHEEQANESDKSGEEDVTPDEEANEEYDMQEPMIYDESDRVESLTWI